MRLATSISALAFACTLTACASAPQNPIYQQTTKYKASSPYDQNVQQANYQTQSAAPITYARAQTAPQTYAPQSAGYTRVNSECLSKESNRKLIGAAAGGVVGGLAGRKLGGDNKTLGTVAGAAIGGAAGYGIADKTINCDPINVPAAQSAVITPAYQPTYEPAPALTQAAVTTPHAPVDTQPTGPQGPGIQETVDAPGDEGTPGYYAVNGLTPPAPEQAAPIQAAQIQTAPPAAQIVEVAVPSPAPTEPPAHMSGTARHTIIKGDTVYSLARNSCVSLGELKQINGINDEFYIRVGQDVTIPTGRCQIKNASAK